MVICAEHRKESRGLHYTLTYPGMSDLPRDTVLVRGKPSLTAWPRE
jgi:L-aspartate oxidase